jgi:Type I phosphodiesterase / nucleotide pyrophosphatase
MPTPFRPVAFAVLASLLATSSIAAPTAAGAAHNVILFVPDGLRNAIVDATTAPEMNALRKAGVTFANPHSIFPTFTTANASTMATGHLLGDTGDFSNTIYTGYKVPVAGYSFTPFLENDPVIADVDEHFGGNYLDEDTILVGRAFSEAMPGGTVPVFTRGMRLSAQTATGLVTMLKFQQVGSVRYIDAAGFRNRTVGL